MDQGSLTLGYSEQIYHILRKEIISHKLECGQRLTVHELGERFQLSSKPVRQALDKLSADGLVDGVLNDSARVVGFGREEIIELYESCLKLDSKALELALASERCKDFCSALAINISLQESADRFENLESFLAYSDHFHDLFYIYAADKELYESIKKLRGRLSVLASQYQSKPETRHVVLREHRHIAEAAADGEADAACRLLEKHLERAMQELLEQL